MRKNILFGSIEVIEKNKKTRIEKAVFIEDANEYKGLAIVKKIDCKIVGQTNTSKSYTEVKASNEKRNKITGTYE
jgi:hypothetical protein